MSLDQTLKQFDQQMAEANTEAAKIELLREFVNHAEIRPLSKGTSSLSARIRRLKAWLTLEGLDQPLKPPLRLYKAI